ncbi:LAMI_0B00738g1_1 [Lachancea mirantina]|uniref:Ammonium transporter n=1 Tax=Lachancea mirantina TaxID=1230905 RepID=A0A1G4ITG4_9SACH|nr:LAMI_0B00738g1_1 [Lachancea mirantina]
MSLNLTGTPSTSGTGGSTLDTDLNTAYDLANMVWVGTAGALVWIMVPGIGLLYSGLSRKKHALSLLWASIMTCGVVSFQWFWWGYSLVFAHNTRGNGFIGTLEFFGFKDVLGAPSSVSTVPDILFAFFQGMFAMVTGILMVGGACERARLMPMMVFLFLWITIVYCPIACWTWNAEGWLAVFGALDYAGGGPVHITSGHGALIYAMILGKRNDPVAKSGMPKYKPHSVTSVVLGTVFLWFGWFGFNGGSAGNATIRAWYSCVSTNLAAACAALTWMFIDYFRFGRKWTTVGLCSGAIAGLVGITPAAGFVPVWASVIIGIVTAVGCNFAVDLKNLLHIDDGMDVYALHGVGGAIGSVMTGIFAADYVNDSAGAAAVAIDGGWINHHYKQVGYQLAAICCTVAWSSVVTAILLLIMDRIPFLRLRLRPEEEELGTDSAQIGEFTYEEDAVYIPEPVRSKVSAQVPEPPTGIDDKIAQNAASDGSISTENEARGKEKVTI